jgi:hypothetical protein
VVGSAGGLAFVGLIPEWGPVRQGVAGLRVLCVPFGEPCCNTDSSGVCWGVSIWCILIRRGQHISPEVAEIHNRCDAVQPLPGNFKLQFRQQPLCEVVDQALIFNSSCPFCILQVAVCKIPDRLGGVLPAALKPGDGRGPGLSLTELELLLKIIPISKLAAASPTPGRASEFDFCNFEGDAIRQIIQVSNFLYGVYPNARVL